MRDAVQGAEVVAALAELAERAAETTDIDVLVDAVLGDLAERFGFGHSLLLLHDEHSGSLVTLASHGYDAQGIGSEVPLGVGIIGMAAARREAMRAANLKRLLTYARSVRQSAEEHGVPIAAPEIPLPGLRDPQSQLAVPMVSGGALIGVIAVESDAPLVGFDDSDEHVLRVVATITARSIVAERALAGDEVGEPASERRAPTVGRPATRSTDRRSRLRHFTGDGSTFLDDCYVIRGVAGRLLWKLAREHVESGRTDFTNREARLDPDLHLPEYRDNFESRLILLKRRLDEGRAPVRIVSTGRGRFRLDVECDLELEPIAPGERP